MKKVSLFLLLSVINTMSFHEQNSADPNFIGCAIEKNSTLQLRVGEIVPYRMFTFGGFFESRNERVFNQNVLPNHNWRGYILAEIHWPLVKKIQSKLYATFAFEHESAHATMGIVEPDLDHLLMIYDHHYRKVSLNALKTGVTLHMYDQKQAFFLKSNLLYYLRSKNTPELPGLKTTHSEGIAIGGKYRYTLSDHLFCVVSIYERYIVQSSKRVTGEIFFTTDKGEIEEQKRSYPIINSMNTFSVTGGIGVPLFQSRHFLEFHLKWLAGNPGGYIDSRNNCHYLAAGITLSRK